MELDIRHSSVHAPISRIVPFYDKDKKLQIHVATKNTW